MNGYGSQISGLQSFYGDIAEGAGMGTEAVGGYHGKQREIGRKSTMWNQALDSGFSLFQGYQEGAAEHAELSETAEAYGFEYEAPKGIFEEGGTLAGSWEKFKGVSDKTLDKTFTRRTDTGFHEMSGKDLRDVSDLYQAGGKKAVGKITDFGESGTYADAMQVDTSGAYRQLSRKPDLPTGSLGEGWSQEYASKLTSGQIGKTGVSESYDELQGTINKWMSPEGGPKRTYEEAKEAFDIHKMGGGFRSKEAIMKSGEEQDLEYTFDTPGSAWETMRKKRDILTSYYEGNWSDNIYGKARGF